ncbi:MAG: M1 family metallopeptidase [Lewinellaceae bacterium]|nr:M1 family metallopeptidase [Lewinellaceae bacterium]
MRISLLFLSLLLTLSSAAQKRIHAADWCANGKQLLATPPPTVASDMRSDSIDILSTTIALAATDFAKQEVSGYALIEFAAKVDGIAEIRLDLLNMTIDQVAPAANWSYDGALLQIELDTVLNIGQSKTIRIDYHGKPAQDASSWGGFYWQGNYAFNLGVGFAADPHNFGRAWFPCFDNFVERCRFTFLITTPKGKPAYCNGYLVSRTTQPDSSILSHWAIDEPIPSYLTCMAAGPFTTFEREYPGETGAVPVEIAVAPADSNKLKASFQHLPDALAAFEHWYGPYRWNKIGYAIVPFNQGAMEHATNVAFMNIAVDGSLDWETLMAHELSHQWWGNLATCSTADDMWLNEGWATFSEHLFLEQVYGRERYLDEVRRNFLTVLEDTHVNEGGYRAITGLPHDLTYGSHVYDKGAVVAHNLRGYLGDALFRDGLRETLDDQAFQAWSSADFRDKLSAITGVDLTDFFNDWVFQPGFAHFSIDSLKLTFSPVDAPTQILIFVKQKLRGATHYYQQVPLEFTVVDPFGNREYRKAVVSGDTSAVEITVPSWFFPQKVWVNTRQQLTFARADQELTVKNTGSVNFSPARLLLNVKNLPQDSARIRVEHHYAMPDTAGTANPQHFRFSNRYWSVDALHPFEAEATIIYDGNGKLDQLDTELFAQTGPNEDSIILAYRPGPGHPWQEHPNYFKNTIGSAQNRYGILRPLDLPLGQYAIAKGVGTVAVKKPVANPMQTRVSPNPAMGSVRIEADQPFGQIQIFNAAGELVLDQKQVAANAIKLEITGWVAGTYWAILRGDAGIGVAGPFLVH